MQNVTLLGPQSPWTSNLLSAIGVTHFTNEEFKEKFDKLANPETQSIEKEKVHALLKQVYGFQPMPEESGLFVTALELDSGGVLGWDEMESGLDHIRGLMEEVAKNATEHDSFQDWKDDMIKHRRLRKGPQDRFKAPMTEAQSIGWHEEGVHNERVPKLSCAETRYADEMIKSGKDLF